MADSEECYSESTMSSVHEASQQTAVEDQEEVGALDQRGNEEAVALMANVHWSLLEPQRSEVVSMFNADVIDQQKLVEHECRVEEVVKPSISNRAQTLVLQQTHR